MKLFKTVTTASCMMMMGLVFAPQAKSQRAEIIDCENKLPKDLAVTLLTKMFTKYPNLHEDIAKANAWNATP